MRGDKQQVLKLRKLGKSYNAIRQEIRIPKSTLSEWLRPHKWSRDIASVLSEKSKEISAIHIRRLNKIRGKHLVRLYRCARTEAYTEFDKLKYHPLFIAGIMIYWGEGDKVSGHGVRIANTDPGMIRLFVNFMIHVCQIPRNRIKAWILLYPDLDEGVCKKFWVKNSGLGDRSFTKCIIIKGRHKTNRVRYGVCNVGISSKYFKNKMLVWLKLLPSQLLNKKYYLRV